MMQWNRFLHTTRRGGFVTMTTTTRSFSTSNMFDPSSFWKDLRQKAANAITSSLDEKERQELLSKYAPPPPPPVVNENQQQQAEDLVDRETLTKTISEAVAEARMKEAQSQTATFQEKMDQLKREMEQASQARIESEVKRRLQQQESFQKWQNDLQKETAQQEQQAVTTEAQATAETAAEVTAMETSETATTATIATTTKEETPHDAVLGPALMNLGIKRLHIASAEALTHLPVWKQQRTYRHDRAKAMAKDKMKSLHLGMPGVIGLFQDKNGNLSILDGQHRVGMMKILAEKKADIDLSKVLVEVHTEPEDATATDQHATDLFVEINKAEPVKLVDMPGVAKKSERKILDQAAENLRDSYPDMFSPSQNCRAPHLNLDNLRDNLFAAGVMKKHSINTHKALLTWLLEKNDALKVKYNGPEVEGVSARALQKAQKFDFYLGMESGWMYE